MMPINKNQLYKNFSWIVRAIQNLNFSIETFYLPNLLSCVFNETNAFCISYAALHYVVCKTYFAE